MSLVVVLDVLYYVAISFVQMNCVGLNSGSVEFCRIPDQIRVHRIPSMNGQCILLLRTQHAPFEIISILQRYYVQANNELM